MFERELAEPLYLDRWTIVRTVTRQSVSDHMYLVSHYANDICCFLGLGADLHCAVLQAAIWHDVDEQFTGDLPGPNKRGLLDAIGPEASQKWKAKLVDWMDRTFDNHRFRSGNRIQIDIDDRRLIDLILKVADWMEAAVRMGNEFQMGNQCAKRHIGPNLVGALEVAKGMMESYTGMKIDTENVPHNPNLAEQKYAILSEAIESCVRSSFNEQSAGPWITREDAGRTYHDPCVDSEDDDHCMTGALGQD